MNLDRLKYRYWQHTDWHNENSPLEAVYCNAVDGCDPTIAISDFEFCTGLKDKNGNLIYEGDIVICGGEKGIVKFGFYRRSDEHFPDSIYGFYIEWYYPKCHFRKDFGYWATEERIEIIGNIHEQAEQKD